MGWLGTWAKRKALKWSSGPADLSTPIGNDLSGFPLFITIFDSQMKSELASGSAKFAFTKPDGTTLMPYGRLNFSWGVGAGSAYIQMAVIVRVDVDHTQVAGNTFGYIYYDNTQTDQENKSGVPLSSCKGFFTLGGDSPGGGAPQVTDWSGNGNDGTDEGSPTQTTTTVPDWQFNGSTDAVTIGVTNFPTTSGPFAVLIYGFTSDTNTAGTQLALRDSGDANGIELTLTTDTVNLTQYSYLDGSSVANDSSLSRGVNGFNTAALTCDGTNVKFYSAGQLLSTTTPTLTNTTIAHAYIAKGSSATGYYGGTLGYVQVYNAIPAHFDDWANLFQYNLALSAGSITLGSQELFSTTQKNDSDTLGVAFSTETPSIIMKVSASDTLGISFSGEAPAVTQTVSGTDTTAVSFSSESTSVSISALGSETLSVAISEAPVVHASIPGFEQLDVSIIEAISSVIHRDRTDILSVALVETASWKNLVAGTQILDITLSEATLLTDRRSSSDALSVSIDESSSLNVSVVQNEFINVRIGEVAYGSDLVSASEQLDVAITDAEAALPKRIASDQLNVTVSDAATAAVQANDFDIISIRVGDRGSIGQQYFDADTLSIAVSEVESFRVLPSASDTLAVSISDAPTANTVVVHRSEADNMEVSLDERMSIARSLADADSMDISVSELQSIRVMLANFDQLDLSVGETSFATSRHSDTDSLSVGLSEIASILARVQALERIDVRFLYETPIVVTAGPVVDFFTADITSGSAFIADLRLSPLVDFIFKDDHPEEDLFLE